MTSVAVYVGLDYHQNVVQVCVMNGEGRVLSNRKVNNYIPAIVEVVRRLGRPAGVAIEACCGAADLADKLHQKTGWSVSLAHTGFVARMKQNPDKTDYGDAKLLADLLRVGYLPKVWLAPEEIRRLRRLVRYRQQRVDQRRNVKLRIRALLRENRLRCPFQASAWTRLWLGWLRDTPELGGEDRWLLDQHLEDLRSLTGPIQEAEELLESRAKDDAVIRKLRSFQGIGLVTAVTMRAEIGRFDRFQSGKQLARFCGLSPRNASSGERQADAGLIQAGNRQLRAVLIQLGQRVAQRIDGRWSALVCRMLNQGKAKNVVVAAVANRYMRWLYHQMQPERLAT
jgi:transposase